MNNTNSSIPSMLPPAYQPAPLPFLVCWSVMGLASTVLNVVVCCIVFCNARMLTITNAFVVSLSVSDLLAAAVLVPIYIAEEYTLTKVPISGYVIAVLLLASIFNLCAVTYERFVALTKPFGYRVIMNKRKVSIIIFASWFIPVLISLLPLAWHADPSSPYHKAYMIITLILFVLLPCVAMIWVYARLLKIIRNFIQRNRRRTSSGNKTGERAGTEEKAARVFAIILAMFLLCWLPLIYINACTAFQLEHLITQTLLYVSFFTLLLNTIMDPLIFAFLKRDFKESIFKSDRRPAGMMTSMVSRRSEQEELSPTCMNGE
ncbi:predicted protein [Nematostella vectensis]|uniref:G-protein coupled receptors family 1 profile domain-containing protein n=1 Tax=Nematostella vectensis TaxID=45351 RepID=A7RMF3_NEMVE|nr:octopamine receptor beta-3R [Nematostella vectensis]XP_032220186.1 octopamine receptor beta-3R [Nematostella vectensis]XP_032220189.1 octopamine receptor beta-3R [Nematostella vectensis]EDO47331.1 predicted protein [Nematostella vectensis]|eukprot:XP_001639394.1 predicted protein [Nematostella vectensis]